MDKTKKESVFFKFIILTAPIQGEHKVMDVTTEILKLIFWHMTLLELDLLGFLKSSVPHF